MIAILVSVLQSIVAQYLDRRSLHCLASSHRNLLHILSDPRSYIFNTTYRPRYLGELNADLQSIGALSATETNQTSTAFPSYLTSPAARKTFLSCVQSVDLRYCRDDVKLAPEVPVLLSLVKSVRGLSMEGDWTYALSVDEGADDYYHDKRTPLRPLLLQLPLRSLCISGPVWEKEIGVVNELHDLAAFDVSPELTLDFPNDRFHKYPSLRSACFTDRVFETSEQHNDTDDWFPSLRSLSLRITGPLNGSSVANISKLSLTSLYLHLPLLDTSTQVNRIRMLLAPNTPLSQSLTTLRFSAVARGLDIFELALGFPCLTSLRMAYYRIDPTISLMTNMIALTEANPRLQSLDVLLPGWMLADGACETYFPVELAHKLPFSGDLSWRFTDTHNSVITTFPFLHLPFFSSISTLEISSVTVNYANGGNLSSLNALHTAKLSEVRCSISPLRWLKQIAPNVRHLHLRGMDLNSTSICSLFPDLLSLEIQEPLLADDDPSWLDNFARLPLRCIALGYGSAETLHDISLSKIGEWMQRILLDANSPSFAALRYVMFIPSEHDPVAKVSEVVPLLPQICAARPRLQMDVQDAPVDEPDFLLDYERCMQICLL